MSNKFKVKRGTNLSNITTAPEAGELIYKSDTNQLFVGNGSTAASALTAIGGTGTVDTSGTPIAQEYARFTDANTIEGRSAAGVRTDLGLNIGTNVQAQDDLLQDIADFPTSTPGNDGKVVTYQDSDGSLVLSTPSVGTITSVSGMTNNNVLTASGSTTISGESNLTFDNSSLTIGGSSAYTVGGTPKLSLQGAGLNIGANANDLSYIRRIATGEYQWQTWNGANDGEIHLQPYGGKVGIGTATPSKKLSIKGTGTDLLYLEGDGITSTSTTNSDTGGSVRTRSAGGAWQLYTGGSANSASASGATFAIEVDENQRVGIGTTSPSYNLHVKSASGSHAEVRIETPNQTNGSVPALSFNNGDRIYSLGVMTNESFSIRDGSDSWATRLSINTSGVVDIPGSLTLGTALALAEGGTGATSASGARSNLGAAQSTTFTTNGMLSGRGTTAIDTTGDSAGLTINYLSSTASGKPTGTDHSLLTMSYSSAWQNQIAQDWRNDGRMFIRGQNNGTWSSWHQVFSDDDVIPSANLDADTAHLSTNQTFTGTKTFSSAVKLQSELDFTGNGNKIIDVETLENSDSFRIRNHNPLGNVFHDALKLVGNGGAHLYYNNSKKLETTNTGATVTGNIVVSGTVDGRDVASDGSKLDGIESGATADQTITLTGDVTGSGTGSFATVVGNLAASKITSGTFDIARIPTTAIRSNYRLSTNASSDANSASTSGIYRIDSGESNIPGGITYGTLVTFNNLSDTGFQIAADYHAGGGSLQWRAGNSSTFSGTGSNTSWFKIWNEDNDGSGSGLDADLLDGIQASGFTRAGVESGTPNTAANKTTFTCNDAINTTNGNQSGLQVWQDTAGADAFMTFHVAGDYAVYFGLDGGTNDLAVGGWSRGANSYKVWHQGNDGSGSTLDADLLDGLQGSSYWTKSGSWVGDLASNGYSRVQGVSNGGGEFVLALKNNQLHSLIDGSYFAYEGSTAAGGGFWSSYNSAYGNATGFKATGISTIEVKQQDGGTANLHVTQQISTDYGVRFNNGNTDFMFYNNTGDNLFYLRDLTNAQMLQTWTTSSTTIHKPLYVTGNLQAGSTSNPVLTILNTATAAGSGPTLSFGHDQGGGLRAGAIKTHLTDGSTSNRTALLRFHHTQNNADVLKLQLGDNYVRQYQKGDTSDYLETMVHDDYVEFHVAHGSYAQITTDSGYVGIGPRNSSWCHFYTDRAAYYFDKTITAGNGIVQSYNNGAGSYDLDLRRAQSTDDRIVIEASEQKFIIDAVERLSLTSSGAVINGHCTLSSGKRFSAHNESSYNKYSMYAGSGSYAIGMFASTGFGAVDSWAMTFTFSDDTNRGFLWRKTSHSSGQGAMSLNTEGKLNVAHSVRVGYGISDGTAPGATYGLDVSGSIGATADVVAYISSDKRLKDNIKNIANPLEKLNKLNGVEFDWNDKQDLYKGHDIGVIAQEVEEVLPEIVDTREDGHKAVKYDRMVALLIEAVKEQQQQINELKEKLNG